MKEVKYILGDLVRPDGSIAKIISIAPGLGKGNIEIGFSNGWHFTAYYKDFTDAILGILLTPEILEKNGWKLLKHHERNSYDDVSWSSYHKPAETNISLRFYPEEGAFFLFLYAQEISETPIRYIHQLQHILFGLGLNSEIEM